METSKKIKILLVEDDAYIADLLKTALINKGYEVNRFEEGEQALAFLDDIEKSKGTDIVLLDLILPKMHGFDVLKRIKSSEKTAQIPVLILSNLGDEKDIKEGLRLGAVDYMVKANFLPQDIAEKVDEVVNKNS